MKKQLIIAVLVALAGSASAAPFDAEFSTTGGVDSVSFEWDGAGGASYALEQSPDNRNDIAVEHPETVSELSAMIKAWLKATSPMIVE